MTATTRSKGPNRARETAARRTAQQRAAERRRKSLLAGLVAGVVLIAATIIALAVYNGQRPKDVAIPKGGDRTGITLGKSTAKTRIDVYADFICPYCKLFEEQSGAALAKWITDGTAKVTYHPIAFLDDQSSTRYATRASSAAACAADEGKFAEFTSGAYARQPKEGTAGLSDDQLIGIGTAAGAGSSFGSCVKGGTYKGWVAQITEAASKSGVNGTPTVLVNGAKLPQPTVAALTEAVEKAAR